MAENERRDLSAIAEQPLMSRLKIWDINSFGSVLEICADALGGELALARADYPAAIAHLEAGVTHQDALRYNEPPDFHYPVRQSLGAALLAAGRPADAESVYRRDLELFPENGWSLFGLEQSLRAQGRNEEADGIHARFDYAWRWADVTLRSSRF
jgi:tetratricopeptide (TPR) repeat protein